MKDQMVRNDIAFSALGEIALCQGFAIQRAEQEKAVDQSLCVPDMHGLCSKRGGGEQGTGKSQQQGPSSRICGFEWHRQQRYGKC
jgi:hypothetical protein